MPFVGLRRIGAGNKGSARDKEHICIVAQPRGHGFSMLDMSGGMEERYENFDAPDVMHTDD